jgi:hypothetical protein
VEDVDNLACGLALVVCLGRHVWSTGGEVVGGRSEVVFVVGSPSQPHPAWFVHGDPFVLGSS